MAPPSREAVPWQRLHGNGAEATGSRRGEGEMRSAGGGTKGPSPCPRGWGLCSPSLRQLSVFHPPPRQHREAEATASLEPSRGCPMAPVPAQDPSWVTGRVFRTTKPRATASSATKPLGNHESRTQPPRSPCPPLIPPVSPAHAFPPGVPRCVPALRVPGHLLELLPHAPPGGREPQAVAPEPRFDGTREAGGTGVGVTLGELPPAEVQSLGPRADPRTRVSSQAPRGRALPWLSSSFQPC